MITYFKDEIFKPVNGIPDYLISNLGRVYSYKTNKFLKHRINRMKYPQVVLQNKAGIPKDQKIHRLVAIHFIPNPHNYKMVNHIDNDPTNCVVSNLEWCTAAMNAQHCFKQGRMYIPHVQGEQHPDSIITDEIVRTIRRMHDEEGYTKRQIATHLNLKYKHIGKVVRREIWKHVI